MWSLSTIILLCVIGSVLGNDVAFLPMVSTAQGAVVGSVASDGEYFEFYGIPYADSTAGTHRFKAPLPPPSYTDAFIADRKDIKCVRPLGVGFEGTEDCLVANIFTPSLGEASSLPVMVWVKGREFDRVYENELSFKHFVEKDVIVVSLNFRESIFGFLCLGTEIAPGNAGLKDIIAGLTWIKENISGFGGNPNNVTLFGHGSGAAAVDLITLSPMSKDLVHGAITQSGNALAPWAVSRDNLASAVKVAEALGHTVNTIEELSEVFTRVSVPALMAIINEFDLSDNSLVFAPCVEREELAEPAFLAKTPFEIISQGNFLDIPFITGFVDYEGTIRAEEVIESQWLERMDTKFTDFLQADLEFQTDDVMNTVAANVRSFYFANNSIQDNLKSFIHYQGDTMILVSALREVNLRSKSSSSPLYLYQFSYKGTLGQPFVGPIEVDSAAHSEELAYLFYEIPIILENDDIADKDLTVADILIERWTNFAKYGNPFSETFQVEWQPYTAQNSHYIRVLDESEINGAVNSTLEIDLINPHPVLMTFWNEIYEHHFLDAQSNWKINIRDVNGTEDGNTDQSGNGNGEESGGNDSNNNGGNETGSGDTNGSGGTDGDINIGSGDGNGVDDGSGDGDSDGGDSNGGEGGGSDGDDNGGGGGNQTDSASTAVGYTFLILSAFALLDKFHSTQILL